MQRIRISSYISESTTSLLLLLFLLLGTSSAEAQSKKKWFTAENDSTPFFNGVAVSVDLVGAGQLLLSDYGQYEAALRINLKDRYFPIFELGYGISDATDETTNINYKTKAPYGRFGCDFNLLKNKHDIYRLYAGARYAFTSYKFDLAVPVVTDPVYGGTSDMSTTDIKCNYHWMELVMGVDAKIAGPLHLGWSVRYKRRLFHDDGSIGNTWYVPGYGIQGGSRIGATFNVIFEL